jgi:hypothetical protein
LKNDRFIDARRVKPAETSARMRLGNHHLSSDGSPVRLRRC